MAKKGKPQERNWISSNSSTKQRQKDNHIKAKKDKTQQNSKCRLCGDRDETTNHIIKKRNKLALKEYKPRHDWVSKVIHWELCKKLKFDHTNKWYMHNPETLLGFWHTNRSPNLGKMTHLIILKKGELAELWTLLSRLTTE